MHQKLIRNKSKLASKPQLHDGFEASGFWYSCTITSFERAKELFALIKVSLFDLVSMSLLRPNSQILHACSSQNHRITWPKRDLSRPVDLWPAQGRVGIDVCSGSDKS